MSAAWGILLPFLGTALGAACVFFLKRGLGAMVQQALSGFAAGVMAAASVWSLLLPAMAKAAALGRFAFVPAAIGLLLGVGGMAALDGWLPRICSAFSAPDKAGNAALFLAVTLHNIPEGMAVGVAYAGCLAGDGMVTLAAAGALALGIAVQNFPEGAIISLPLRADGQTRWRAFSGGVLSGIVEPIAAMLTLIASGFAAQALPYLLGFAAGAMLYVVADELVPQAAQSRRGAIFFVLGFALMMALDVALG